MSSSVPMESCVVHAINQIILLKCAEVLLIKIADHEMVLTWSTQKIPPKKNCCQCLLPHMKEMYMRSTKTTFLRRKSLRLWKSQEQVSECKLTRVLHVMSYLRNMCPPGTLITETDRTLKMYSKSTLPVLGTCRVSMHNPKNSKKYNVEFVVVKGNYTPLIVPRAS